jgi:hypothetical protein
VFLGLRVLLPLPQHPCERIVEVPVLRTEVDRPAKGGFGGRRLAQGLQDEPHVRLGGHVLWIEAKGFEVGVLGLLVSVQRSEGVGQRLVRPRILGVDRIASR